jgi:hypothetical protein
MSTRVRLDAGTEREMSAPFRNWIPLYKGNLLPPCSGQKIWASGFSETMVTLYKTTRLHFQGDNLHDQCRENFRSRRSGMIYPLNRQCNLKMQARGFPETLVTLYKTTRRRILGDNLNNHCRENLKSRGSGMIYTLKRQCTTQNMEAQYFSETLKMLYQYTRCHILQDDNVRDHRRENSKSHRSGIYLEDGSSMLLWIVANAVLDCTASRLKMQSSSYYTFLYDFLSTWSCCDFSIAFSIFGLFVRLFV